jgi:hypothetical protein
MASASRARYGYEKPDPAQAEDRRVFAVLAHLREFASRLVLGRRGNSGARASPGQEALLDEARLEPVGSS